MPVWSLSLASACRVKLPQYEHSYWLSLRLPAACVRPHREHCTWDVYYGVCVRAHDSAHTHTQVDILGLSRHVCACSISQALCTIP